MEAESPRGVKMLRTMISLSLFLCVLNFVSFACFKAKTSRINNSFVITPLTQALNYLSRCHLRKLPGWRFSHRLSKSY